jgi:hypothetical protein
MGRSFGGERLSIDYARLPGSTLEQRRKAIEFENILARPRLAPSTDFGNAKTLDPALAASPRWACRRCQGDDPLCPEKGAVSARWINALLKKKPARLVRVAVTTKLARIA